MTTPAPDCFDLDRPEITLGNLLKLHFSMSGGQAKQLIQAGLVLVDEAPCLARGKRLRGGETVTLEGFPAVTIRKP